MASLPQRPDSQRRASPDIVDSQEQQNAVSTPTSLVRSRSATSEDSQTLLLNSPPTDSNLPSSNQPSQPTQPPTQPIAPPSTEDQTKKCWICFADSSEDDPTTPPAWRSPCPCALTAHEVCLLDWIADLEAPGPSNRQNGNSLLSRPQILCPQCKNEIKLSRPRDYVVDAVRGFERVVQKSLTPSALGAVALALHQVSVRHGVWTIFAVFGAEDGYRIVRPLVEFAVRPPLELEARDLGPTALGRLVRAHYMERLAHWRLFLGLPLISPVLVLSRTGLADYVLPVLPVMFLASMSGEEGGLEGVVSWPPSAAVCFSLLPYVRAGYNELYQRVFGEREKRWMREIQPRQGQGRDDGGPGLGEAQAQGGEPGEEENVFEIRVDGGIWDDWGGREEEEVQLPQEQEAANRDHPLAQADDNALPPPIPENRPPLAELPQLDENNNNNNNNENIPPAPAPAAANPPAAAAAQQNERRLSFSPTAIAESILGALLFPSLASTSGELLKLLLPLSWTTPPASAATNCVAAGLGGLGLGSGLRSKGGGILQHKWGRSLVGGCLLVVVKDAVVLYVRWRMAGMQRARRVLDYEGRRGRGEGGEEVRS